jgi:hypothetical protein
MTPEGRVKTKLKRELGRIKAWHWWPVPAGYGEQMVDCVAFWNGRMTLIECKREGVNEPTARQGAIMRNARKHGIITYLVTMDAQGALVWIELRD